MYRATRELAESVKRAHSTVEMTCQINGQTQGLCPQYSFNSATNQIMNPGYTYDWAGNLTSDGTNAYGYDAEGQQASLNGNPQTFNALRQLVAFPEPWTTLYNLFDSSGRLVARSEPGGELWYQAVVLSK